MTFQDVTISVRERYLRRGESSRTPVTSITHYSKYEVRSMIRFLAQQGVISLWNASSTYPGIWTKRYELLKRRQTGSENFEKEERVCTIRRVCDDRRYRPKSRIIHPWRSSFHYRRTSWEVSECFSICCGSEVVLNRFGHRKLSARRVPKILTDEHKEKRTESGRLFLKRHDEQGWELLDGTVTRDETWIPYTTPETKRQSMRWHHTHSTSAKKFRTTVSDRKVMVSVFWNRKGVILIDPSRYIFLFTVWCDGNCMFIVT